MYKMSNVEKITIQCQDGYVLSGAFYPATSQNSQTHPILLCPATGITKKFYHHFCTWLAQQGYSVLTFDFRGIGDSLYTHIKHSKASIVQWGQFDIAAGIDKLCELTASEQIILVGHSAGGQLLGVVPNFDKVKKVIAVAGSSGYVKNLKGRTKLLAPLMFKGIFPLAKFTIGYGPTKAIGMGENLPKDVARQWAQFCSHPGYVLNAIGDSISKEQDYHHQIKCPITSLWAPDDEIATEENVKDFLRIYPNAPTDRIKLTPSDYDHKFIGHMLMFKPSHQNIWPVIESQIHS